MNELLSAELFRLREEGLYRSLALVESEQGREICYDGRQLLNFCSNDYLGLAADRRLIQAASAAMKKRGFGTGASRLVCGNGDEHAALEKEIADLKQTQAALLFSSGYMANTGIIQSLVGRNDIVFSDRLNHASIVDGIVLSRATMKRYPHRDMAALAEMLESLGNNQRKLIVTDSVFSMDGDVAPLAELADLAGKYKAWLMVDEAHAFGLFGANGAGMAQELGVADRVHVQMGTLSKAAGSFGAYAAGSAVLIDYLVNHARSLIYSTAMPPGVAAASRAALCVMRQEPERREKVRSLSSVLRRDLQGIGLEVPDGITPIIPVLVGDPLRALRWSKLLLEEGLLIPAIRPPTVPAKTARLRVTVTAKHTHEDIARCVAAFRKAIAHG